MEILDLITEIKQTQKKYYNSKKAKEQAEEIEKQVEAKALERYNTTSGKTLEDSCLILDYGDDEFNLFLTYVHEEFNKIGIDNPHNNTYSWKFTKEFLTNKGNYISLAPKILELGGHELEAEQFKEFIKGYVREEKKEEIINLIDNFIKDFEKEQKEKEIFTT